MSQELNREKEMGVTRAEETLRLVARMPTPEGLGERVKMRLKDAPRGGRVLAWPDVDKRWSQSALVRNAAAAIIVCVVGGGAWQVYSHVQSTTNAAHVMPAPIRQSTQGSFSNAGAMRSPQTLNGPVLVHPVKPQIQKRDAARTEDEKKASGGAKAKSGTKDIRAVGNKLQPMKPPALR